MCDECEGNYPTTSVVLNGTYLQLCKNCKDFFKRQTSITKAQYHRDRDREKNRRDIIQPYHKNLPNPEFIRAYPEESEDYFTKEELKKYG